MGGGADLEASGMKIEINGLWGSTFEDQAIEAGGLEFGPPKPAHCCLVPDAGQGRSSDHRSLTGPGDEGSGKETGQEDQRALRVQRIQMGIQLRIEDLGRQAASQEVGMDLFFRDLVHMVCSGGQVTPDKPSVVSMRHDGLLCQDGKNG
jgi:hypothetical protein